MAQKARSFAHMGVGNLFAKPGHAEFYRALATDPATRHLVHVSRLDVGRDRRRGQSRADLSRLLLSPAGELRRRRAVALRAGRRASARPAALAIDRGFRIFDFTIGDERYKRDWCDTELKLYDHIAAATWRGALIAMPMLAGAAAQALDQADAGVVERLQSRRGRLPARWRGATRR